MSNNLPPAIEVVQWRDISERVSKVNPQLAQIIDDFKPTDKHVFVKVAYPYGVDVRDQGVLQLPTEDFTLKAFEQYPSPAIKKLLNYSSSPIALILNKSAEVYVRTPEGRTVPFKIFKPGVNFGVWEIMGMPKVSLRQGWDWSISAGAKTSFMLAKISDANGHERLKRRYKIKSYIPDNVFDHAKIFSELANVNMQENPWFLELLFFSGEWFKPQEDNIGWVKLRNYWANEAWHQMMHWSNKLVIDFNWEAFIAELSHRRIKLKPYLLDTLKHLVSIGCGTIPGFKIAKNNELVMPTALLQKIYLEDYGLKTYAPLIMQPDFLETSLTKPDAVYYSLQAPTLPEKPIDTKTSSSTMKSLRELKTLMDIFLEVMGRWSAMGNDTYFDFLQHIKYDYFHTDFDQFGVIKPIDSMLKEDKALREHEKHYPDRLFPENSHFLKGCVRIAFQPDMPHLDE